MADRYAQQVVLYQGPDPLALAEELVKTGLIIKDDYQEGDDRVIELSPTGKDPVTHFAETAVTPRLVLYNNLPDSITLDEMRERVRAAGGLVIREIESQMWGDDTFDVLGPFGLRMIYSEPTARRRARLNQPDECATHD